MFLLSYLIRIYELPFFRETSTDFGGRLDYFNSIWLISITITSVGYGDVYPHTNPGKIIAIFAAFWGAFLVSLLVVAATSLFALENNQKKAEKHIILTRSAAKTITIACKYFLVKKQYYIEKIKFNPEIIKTSAFLRKIADQKDRRMYQKFDDPFGTQKEKTSGTIVKPILFTLISPYL